MNANILLHVRKLPNGRVIVTPVEFPGLTVDADDVPTARRLVLAAVESQLASTTGSIRAALADPVVAELDTVEVKIPQGKGTQALRLNVGLIIQMRETQLGTIFVVSAPEARVEFAVSDAAEIAAKARREVRENVDHWPLGSLLSCDETGEVHLETVEVPFPPPSETLRNDSFSITESADDLTALAESGRLAHFDRREALVERALAALGAETHASVMLVGPHAVGKTALIDEVAHRLAAGNVPAPLVGRRLWRISANELIAGSRYTGMWQERARGIIDLARRDRSIVSMGEPGGIIDAGQTSASDNNLARLLRPYVESGELNLICECDEDLYAVAHVSEPSFIDAFQRIDVPEPSEDVAREILALATQRLAARHELQIDPVATATALDLTRRFEPYRGLPGKAVRLLEETIQRAGTDDGEAAASGIGREDVIDAFAERSGMPRMLLTDEMRMNRDEVRAFLEQRVLGQPEAIEQVVDLITVFKAGLHDTSKPLATLFFVGPTGVGKTELGKALAEYLFGNRDRLIRFDMGEYGSGDAVAKLLGSGWIADRKGGELTRRVREQPFCVVLLDEIEKAHPDVYDALLSALGEGRLTDARGKTADFRNAIVIMTSNLGASRRESSALGFTSPDAAEDEEERLRQHFADQAEQFFRPEFFNRIDRLISFSALDQDTIRSIARRHLGSLLMREGITRRQLLVEIDDAVTGVLAEAGFHPRYGARPLLRAIEQRVIQPLARVIVADRPEPGSLIRFTVENGEVKVGLHAIAVQRTPAPRRTRESVPADGSFARTAAEVARLAERIEADGAGPDATRLAEELSSLIDDGNAPGFWDDAESAQRVLARLYQLQQLAERRTAIVTRVEGLVELGERIRQHRDRRRLPEVREAVAEIQDDLELLQLETVAAAQSAEAHDADIRVAPIGPGSDEWAEALLAMYGAWAERTGRTATPLDGEPLALRLAGAATFALLRNERGLHRRRLRNGATLLARVTVSEAGLPFEPPADDDPATVIRGYSEGRHVFVKDTRTGLRTADVEGVLERGLIDDFLVAELRREEATVA